MVAEHYGQLLTVTESNILASSLALKDETGVVVC